MTSLSPWHKILVPVDFSEHSRRAAQEARRFQQTSQTEIVLLHVTPAAFSGLRIQTADVHRQELQEAKERLAALAAEIFPGSSVSCLVKDGHTVEVICDTARMLPADVIFIGTHGLSAVQHYMLGSVAEKVVRHAPCAVLVVR